VYVLEPSSHLIQKTSTVKEQTVAMIFFLFFVLREVVVKLGELCHLKMYINIEI